MTTAPISLEVSASAAALFAPETAVRSSEQLHVFGRKVRVDLFEPDANGDRGRTVLLLHGIGGLLGDGALMRRAARSLAANGFRAGVVHYFNATGTLFATPSNVRDLAPAWKDGLVEIAAHYARTSGAPVGLMGYSLGGFLSVGIAEEVPGVGAVVVMSGGILEEQERPTPARLPPLLVLHGGDDARVSPERAEALMRVARRAGTRAECVMYPHEGHAFGSRAERDALARTSAFFAVRLGAGARP